MFCLFFPTRATCLAHLYTLNGASHEARHCAVFSSLLLQPLTSLPIPPPPRLLLPLEWYVKVVYIFSIIGATLVTLKISGGNIRLDFSSFKVDRHPRPPQHSECVRVALPHRRR
jgi:hypothetical protein